MLLKLMLIALIVIFAAVMLWFLLSFLFKPVGKFFYRLYKDAMDEIENKEQI